MSRTPSVINTSGYMAELTCKQYKETMDAGHCWIEEMEHICQDSDRLKEIKNIEFFF